MGSDLGSRVAAPARHPSWRRFARLRPTPLYWPIAIAPAGASARLHNRSRHHPRVVPAHATEVSMHERPLRAPIGHPRVHQPKPADRDAASPGRRRTRDRCRFVTPPLRVRGACFKALLHRRVQVRVRRCRRVHTPSPSMGFGPPSRHAPRDSLRWSSSDLTGRDRPEPFARELLVRETYPPVFDGSVSRHPAGLGARKVGSPLPARRQRRSEERNQRRQGLVLRLSEVEVGDGASTPRHDRGRDGCGGRFTSLLGGL
jgi:hypothetical protein